MRIPPSTEPISALAVNSALTITAISVLLKPTSIMKGVKSLLAKASPALNTSTMLSSASALRVLNNSRSGSAMDSSSERG